MKDEPNRGSRRSRAWLILHPSAFILPISLPTTRGFLYHRPDPFGQRITGRENMAEQKATNVTWHDHRVSKPERCKLNGHKGAVLWFTGLSACGKSTIANTVDHLLHSRGKHSFVLDGDNIRMGLNKNLGFSAADRAENIRRIGEVAKLFSEAGTVTLTAFISPYKADRDAVRALLAPGDR